MDHSSQENLKETLQEQLLCMNTEERTVLGRTTKQGDKSAKAEGEIKLDGMW